MLFNLMSVLTPHLWSGGNSAEIARFKLMSKPIKITNFDGQQENAHLGFGANVGVDLFTTKDVARLSRKMQKKSSTETNALPLYSVSTRTAAFSNIIFCQLENGRIVQSTDNGDTWSTLSGNAGTSGKGLTVWQDYLWAFTPTTCDIYGPLSGAPAWTNDWWVGTAGATALINRGDVNHFAFTNPSANTSMYINNRNYIAEVKVTGGTFNPASSGTYIANDKKFTMNAQYIANCIGFLPPSSIAIGTFNELYNSQADIVIWDGVSDTTATNIVNIPGASGAVTNLLTKSGVLYGVTTNEAGVYKVNGTSATLIDRLGLRMTNRLSGGSQTTTRVYPNVLVGSADFLGPELLVGVSNYPAVVSYGDSTGLFPYGVWALNIETGVTYTKFPLSHGDINANYDTSYYMGFVKTIKDSKVIVGWSKSTTNGIDALSPTAYISDENTVFIESELFEVGTRIDPETYNKIQYNLVQPLSTGQEISFYYRLSQADNYTLIKTDTLTTLGTNLGGIITPLPFQKAKYVQFAVKMKAGSTTTATPQLVSIYLT